MSEPNQSAGSAVRALGYLAWNLDTSDGGSSNRRTALFTDTDSNGISTTPTLLADGEPTAEIVVRDRRHATAITTSALTAETLEGNGDAVGDTTDRRLQDAAVLTLAARANAVEETATGLASAAAGGGSGEVVVDQRKSGAKDRKTDTAAAKCR